MDEVLIPYAKRISDGRLVTIDEVESGLACNCICDGCGAPMVARKGKEKAHHFGHAPKSANDEKPCSFNFKRGCFWLIKQILEESVGNAIVLPDYKLRLSNTIALHEKYFDVTKASNPVYQQLVSFDLSQNNESAHAVLAIGEHQLQLTFGFSDFSKKTSKSSNSCAVVFVSLAKVYDSYSKEKRPFIEIVKEHIFSSQYKQWLYHPRQAKLETDFASVCDEIIAELRQQAPLQFKQTKNVDSKPARLERQYVVKPRTAPISMEAQDILKFNQRLDSMVNTAATLFNVLNQTRAKHCDNCQHLYIVTSHKCPICGDFSSVPIQLDEYYMDKLAQKYIAQGYVEMSLRNFTGN